MDLLASFWGKRGTFHFFVGIVTYLGRRRPDFAFDTIDPFDGQGYYKPCCHRVKADVLGNFLVVAGFVSSIS